MSRKYSLALVFLVLLAQASCTTSNPQPQSAEQPQFVQSPVPVGPNDPPPDPFTQSPVVKNGEWCRLRAFGENWALCNIHYHRPAEHGRQVAGGALPPCAGTDGTTPNGWVELHYAYSKPPLSGSCDVLRTDALKTPLGDCAAPYIVRTVWANVTATGPFDPWTAAVSDSSRYMEYQGSSTGSTRPTKPVYWKINRDCVEVTEEKLRPVFRHDVRELQARTRVISTTGN